MVSPRATRWQNRLPHALRLRVSACTEPQAHSSPIPCLLGFFILSAVCTLAYIAGVIPHSKPAPPKPWTHYDLPGGFGRVVSSNEAISTRDGISSESAWDLRDGDVLPGVSHARLAKWRASAARSRLSTAADAYTTARATPVDAETARVDAVRFGEAAYSDLRGKREDGGKLCGWPVPVAPARETEEGFQGDSVWYSTNGSEWMQHAYLEILIAEMAGRKGGQAGMGGNESELALWVRPASSDVALLYHLLDTRAFRFLRPSLLPHFRPSAILDAGANIGLASLIFALRFPGALIVAVEPARDNFALLQRNVKHLPRILPVNAALWSHDTRIAVTAGRREGFWAYETHACGEAQVGGEEQMGGEQREHQEQEEQQQEQQLLQQQQQDRHHHQQQQQHQQQQKFRSRTYSQSVPSSAAANHSPVPASPCMPAVSVPSLLQRMQLPRFDYVKIDVEGAEKQVFCSEAGAGAAGAAAMQGAAAGGGWQHDVEVLSVEVHEDLAPGIGACMEGVYPRTRYDVRSYGENTVYFSPHVWVHALKPLDLSVR
ncbi:unnamed protein product [Closterium sp. NIES-53]